MTTVPLCSDCPTDSGICHDRDSECFNRCPCCCIGGKTYDSELKLWAAESSHTSAKPIHMKWKKHMVEHHGFIDKKTHNGNGAPSGAFAFTLTASPTDGLTEADMVSAVRKIMHQKSCPVKAYAWYLEYGKPELKEHPHIHGMYETEKGGVIEKKHFQRAWKIWDPSTRLGAGFRGGYHRPVRDDEKYDNYIKKQDILGETRA